MTYQRPRISTFAIMNCPKLIRFKSHGIHQISAVSPICDISKPSLRNPNFYSSIYAHHCRISIRRAITNKIGRGTEGFYQNQQVEQYAAVKTKKVTLFQLLAFGRHMTELKLIKSANYVRQELAVRIVADECVAHRIRDFQSLPFIVGINPRVSCVYQLYLDAFDKLRTFPPIETLGDNRKFCVLLEQMLQSHLIAIPQYTLFKCFARYIHLFRLAQGMRESSSHLTDSEMDRFMNDILRTRIGRRVLAEQHIKLTDEFDRRNDTEKQSSKIGIINTACHAGQTVDKCAQLACSVIQSMYDETPDVVVDGHVQTSFLYIPDHIEYILFELLKNALTSPSPYRPKDMSKKSTSDLSPTDMVTFRISDQGGGLDRTFFPPDQPLSVWSFARHGLNHHHHTSIDSDEPTQLAGKLSDPPTATAHLGLGLQLARVFAHYWGGEVKLHSMYGYGTDVYVRIITSGHDQERLTTEDKE